MNTLQHLFTYVCGQGDCFLADGRVLPVCERCLGLYLGAAATLVWVLAARLWRRGLPDRSVALADVALLVAAMLGGLHVVDADGPWPMMCGLWTGHVALLWLSGGAGHLGRLARARAPSQVPWRTGDKTIGLAAGPALALAATAFWRWTPAGWWLWTAAALVGLAALAAALAAALVAVIVWAGARAGRTAALSGRPRTGSVPE